MLSAMSANAQGPQKSILKTSLPSAYAASAHPVATSAPASTPISDSRNATTPTPTATATNNYNKYGGLNRQKLEQPGQSNNYNARPGTDPRHLAIALHHAHRIQARKDAETLIFNRILDLVSFPPSPAADPASPSVDDAKAFKAALRPFQPSDYDNLILERNIEGLCGYGLCPREHRKEDPKTKNRIVMGPSGSGTGGRGRRMQFVPREKLEMWCSSECAERALYVKVQLQEQPVWERSARDEEDFLLLEEARDMKQKEKTKDKERDTSQTIGETVHQLDNFRLGGETGSRTNMRDLARERGDSSPALEAGRVDIQLVGKKSVPCESVASPTLRPEDRTGGSIEGHTPKGHREDIPVGKKQ